MSARRTAYRGNPGRIPGILLASWACLLAGPKADAAPEGEAAAFLSTVAGAWQGRAVHTPAGPFSYDIDFALDETGCRSGVAEPGGVHHRWKFCPAGAGLELEFLSDFGGNERPLLLQLHDVAAGTLVFHSKSHEFLKIHARIEADCLRLQVLHHDRLHVEIHLRRPMAGDPAEVRACPWEPPVSPAA